MKRWVLFILMAGLSSGGAFAQAPAITAEQAQCFPEEGNGVVNAKVSPEVGGATVRLYFRWDEHGDMYWVDMVAAGGGQYWGIPARPEHRNERIEYYVSVVDPYGQTLARSESQFSPVQDDCQIQLSPQQVGYANNLVIGETVEAQEDNRVLGFLCDGVVTRVNFEGIMRPDEICRSCVIPPWAKQEFMGAAAAVGAATAIIVEEPGGEPSQSRPPGR